MCSVERERILQRVIQSGSKLTQVNLHNLVTTYSETLWIPRLYALCSPAFYCWVPKSPMKKQSHLPPLVRLNWTWILYLWGLWAGWIVTWMAGQELEPGMSKTYESALVKSQENSWGFSRRRTPCRHPTAERPPSPKNVIAPGTICPEWGEADLGVDIKFNK